VSERAVAIGPGILIARDRVVAWAKPGTTTVLCRNCMAKRTQDAGAAYVALWYDEVPWADPCCECGGTIASLAD
jgi:hypothetical protein